MTVDNAVSPSVSVAEGWISLITLTVLYAVLAVVEVLLMLLYIRKGAEEVPPPPDDDSTPDRPLAFAY